MFLKLVSYFYGVKTRPEVLRQQNDGGVYSTNCSIYSAGKVFGRTKMLIKILQISADEMENRDSFDVQLFSN